MLRPKLQRRKTMIENGHDWADTVGKHAARIFVALLAAMFVYAYLGRFIVG
jgi:hypothetical protein